MARNPAHSPEKIVIVSGPTFAEAAKFTLFGMALGAGLVYFVKKDHTPSLLGSDAFYTDPATAPGATSAAADDAATVADRVSAVTAGARVVLARAAEAGRTVQVLAGPMVHRMVEQGRQVAHEVEARLRAEIDEAGDRPALAEIDETLPESSEKKFVE